MTNIFTTVINNRGFTKSAIGWYMSPDMKFGTGIAVEVNEDHAVVFDDRNVTRFYLNKPEDVKKFLLEVV